MSEAVTRIVLVIASAAAMEVVAALVHRFWMHGPGWAWHQSHHAEQAPACLRRSPGWERNDLYALVFAAAAVAMFWAGSSLWWPLWWIGLGVTVYGAAYAFFHDGIVHRRWPMPWSPRSGYLSRLVQAHRLHHARADRTACVSFGFLYARSPRVLAAELRTLDAERSRHTRAFR